VGNFSTIADFLTIHIEIYHIPAGLRRQSPRKQIYPGLEIYSNAMAGLLDNHFMWQPVRVQYAFSA